jgi:cytochrome c oxidase assembly protein subunit 15
VGASPLAAPLPAPRRALGRFAWFVVAMIVVLIQAGGMVTSTGSGLAYLDWPTANGSWWPPGMLDYVPGLLEHGHRTIGALIGALTLALVLWILAAERRRWLRYTALAALGLVVVQGVIGGKGVELGLPAWTSVLHGILAQVFLCLCAFIAFSLSPASAARTRAGAGDVRAARRLAVAAVAAIFVQLALGAVVRHANLQHVLWLHISMALVVTLLLLVASSFTGARLAHVPGFARLARWLLGVVALQLLLGFVTLAVRAGGKATASVEAIPRALVVTGHVVAGAVMFLMATLLLCRVWQNLAPAEE